MIIENHNIQMESLHHQTDRLISRREVEVRVNNNMQTNMQTNMPEQQPAGLSGVTPDVSGVNLEISRQAMSRFNQSLELQSSVKPALETPASDDDKLELTDKWSVAKHMLEKFFGIKVEIVKPEDFDKVNTSATNTRRTNAPQVELRMDVTEIREHEEHMSFHASGMVTTSDGREIQMEARLDMSKETTETITLSLRAGNSDLTDPLVLNLDGKGVALSDEKIEFDLDMDGAKDSISFLEQGSGFLVLDKNQNGKIDDGGELFGPTTNNGFLELQAHDRDNNSWIDEKDAVFFNLNLWIRDGSGNDQLSSLKENNIGAIYLGRAATPFDLGEGQLRETGIFLMENGDANLIQEIDLRV